VDVVATLDSASRDWLLSILVPTIELRDALITDVADGVQALTAAPIVAVRMIGVVEDAEERCSPCTFAREQQSLANKQRRSRSKRCNVTPPGSTCRP
jgi:hypothetical protein